MLTHLKKANPTSDNSFFKWIVTNCFIIIKIKVFSVVFGNWYKHHKLLNTHKIKFMSKYEYRISEPSVEKPYL